MMEEKGEKRVEYERRDEEKCEEREKMKGARRKICGKLKI